MTKKDDCGTISGYFATFDHDHGDSYGDVILRGSFKNTIERRRASGHPFPLLYNHDFNQIIGRVTDIGEDTKGAYFSAEFFPSEKAQEIRELVKSKVLWQFSFAYDVLSAGKVKAGDGSTVRELREVELYEISITLIPANPRATITDIKGDEAQRRELLKYIDTLRHTQKTHAAERLKMYRSMEETALKDIGKAEVTHNTEWKEARLRALAAIRKEIKKAEAELSRHRIGEATIKTGSFTLAERKAKIQ